MPIVSKASPRLSDPTPPVEIVYPAPDHGRGLAGFDTRLARPRRYPPLIASGDSTPAEVQLIVANSEALVELLGLSSFGSIPGLTEIIVNDASSLAGYDFETMDELTSLSFPNLVSIDPDNTQGGYLWISDCSSLTSLSMPVYEPTNGIDQTLSGNALDATSVNAFLARCVAAAGYVSGTIDLSGGTNAAPTGQGAADVVTLTGRGVTVSTN